MLILSELNLTKMYNYLGGGFFSDSKLKKIIQVLFEKKMKKIQSSCKGLKWGHF